MSRLRLRPAPARLGAALLFLLGVAPLGAQTLSAAALPPAPVRDGPGPRPLPPRPSLPPGADSSDWEANYDEGVRLLRAHRSEAAESAFWWASRLDPSRPEPYFGRWVAFWARDPRRYERYLYDDERVLRAPDVVRNDSLRLIALSRSPFVYQGLVVLALREMPTWAPYKQYRPGERAGAVAAQDSWISYSLLRFATAADEFADAIRMRPKDHWLHYGRALVFAAMRNADSTYGEVATLLAALRADDSREVARVYESKAFLEYALGRVARARGDTSGASAQFRRALEEELGFAPAHEQLGQLAFARRDMADAVREFGEATELAPDDGYYAWQLGRALGEAGRDQEAVVELRRAIALEPWFADAYFSLALAMDRQADIAGTIAAYQAYLAHASRSAPNVARARARLEQYVAP